MAKKYPKETIQKVDELLKEGLSAPTIAKMLGLPRAETISTWIKKYGLGPNASTAANHRNSKSSLPIVKDPGTHRRSADLVEKSLSIWLSVQDIMLERLKSVDFKSAEGIIQGLEISERCISHLACIKETFSESEINMKTAKAPSPIIGILSGDGADVASKESKE